jgi:hypothetical protein
VSGRILCDDLQEDHCGESIKIDFVDTVFHDHVSNHAYENQSVYPGRCEEVGQIWDASKSCFRECACGDQHKAAMKIRTLAPIDRQSKWYREADQFHHFNNEERYGREWKLALNSQSQHGGRRRISEDDDEDCQADAYPAQGAVQAHIVGAYKGGCRLMKYRTSAVCGVALAKIPA